MESNTAPVGQVDNASGNAIENSGEPTEKSVAHSSHLKLLGEKKKVQSENEALKARLEEIENEKLQAQGKYKEHAEGLAKQLADIKAKERNTHKFYSEKVLRQQFQSAAKDLGCVDPEDAFKLCDLAGIEVNDDFTLDGEGLKSALSELQKKKPYLFKREAQAPKDVPPSNRINKFAAEPNTKEELYAELKKLL
jgi:hypothetical protein